MNRTNCFVAILGICSLAGCRSSARDALLGNFKIGERVPVGPLTYNVFETRYLLKMGEGPDAKVPNNRFFVVHLTAVNLGGQAGASIPALTLLDDAGASYNELDTGAGAPQWLGFVRKVRPAESLTGDVVFDVAPRHYKLRIPDEKDEYYALVDLPLTFGDSVPPVDSAMPPAR